MKKALLLSVSILITITNNVIGQSYDLVWDRIMDYSGYTTGHGMVVGMDSDYDLYLAGYIKGDNSDDIFITKLDVNGDTLWTRIFNGTANYSDNFRGAIVDDSGNTILCGSMKNLDTDYDIFIARLNTDGTTNWMHILDYDNLSNKVCCFTMDSSHNIYIVYYTFNASGVYEYYLMKLSPNGDILWNRLCQDDGLIEYYILRMLTDNAGNLVLLGGSSDNIVTTKLTPDGDSLWTRIYDSPDHSDDNASAFTVDKDNSVYVIGNSLASNNTFPWYQFLIIKYDSSGNLKWTDYYNDNSGSTHPVAITSSQWGLGVYTLWDTWDPEFYFGKSFIAEYGGDGTKIWIQSIPTNMEVYNYYSSIRSTYNGFFITGMADSTFMTACFNSGGDMIWADTLNGAYYGGNATNIIVGKDNCLYVGGIGNSRPAIVKYAEVPALNSFSPGINEQFVDYDCNVITQYSLSIDSSSLANGGMVLRGNYSGRINGDILLSDDNKTVTFDPTEPFHPGEIITVTLTKEIETVNGANFRDGGYSWSFVTKSMPSAAQFTSEFAFQAYLGVINIYAANMDADDDIDVVTLNSMEEGTYYEIMIAWNDGNGNFGELAVYTLDEYPGSMECTDANNDGFIDIVYSDPPNSRLAIMYNNGNRTFNNEYINTDISFTSFTVADINNDGYVDFVDKLNLQTLLFKNDVIYDMLSSITYLANSVNTIDYDHDGDIDLVCPGYLNPDSDWYMMMLKNHNGDSITIDNTYLFGDNVLGTVAADMNNDGYQDIIGSQSSGSYLVYLKYNGTRFNNAIDFPNESSGPVNIGDFNADGFNDVAVINQYTNSLEVYLNNRTDNFTRTYNYGLGGRHQDLAIADFDGNGTLDIVTAGESNAEARIFLNKSKAKIIATYPEQNSKIAGDIDNITVDFDQPLNQSSINNDRVIINGSMGGRYSALINYDAAHYRIIITPNDNFIAGEKVTVMLSNKIRGANLMYIDGAAYEFSVAPSNGIGIFGELMTISNNKSISHPLRIVDINNDGFVDFTAKYYNVEDSIIAFINDGHGSYQSYLTYCIPGNYITDYLLYDFNLDGNIDIIYSGQDDYGAMIWVTTLDEEGGNDNNYSYSIEYDPSRIIAADLNEDCIIDLAYTSSSSGIIQTLELFNNDGYYSVLKSNIIPSVNIPFFILPGDIDNNYKMDIIIGENTFPNIGIYRNVGEGVFLPLDSISAGWSTILIQVEDYNNDNYLDILASYYEDFRLIIYSNDNNGGLLPYDTIIYNGGLWNAAFVDCNADGYQDIVALYNNELNYYKNNGYGDFILVAEYTAIPDEYFDCLVTGDVDNDGDIDIATLDYQGNIHIYYNLNIPVINSTGIENATEETIFVYRPNYDLQGADTTISYNNIPSWLAVDADSIYGIPDDENTDTSFTVIVANEVGADTLNVAVTIIYVNDRPEIESAADTSAVEDVFFVYRVTFTDPDGPASNIIYEKYPAWLVADGDSIFGTPLEENTDTTFAVVVSDSYLADTLDVSLEIAHVNDPPIIISSRDTVAVEDSNFVYRVIYNDPDGPEYSILFEDYPQWLNAEDDSIFGIPLEEYADTLFTVIVSDSYLADTANVNITILGVNDAPVITSAIDTTATEDLSFVYRVLYIDPDGPQADIAFEDIPSWMTAEGDSIYGTPVEGCSDTSFTVIVSDSYQADSLLVNVSVNLVFDPVFSGINYPAVVNPQSDMDFDINLQDVADSVTMFYRLGHYGSWNKIAMTSGIDAGEYVTSFQQNPGLSNLEFYIQAVDNGYVRTLPESNPVYNPFICQSQFEDMPLIRLKANQWQMISFPFELNSSANTIEDILVPFLGEPGEGSWRIAKWDAAGDRYFVDNEITKLNDNEGYWIWTWDTLTLSFSGISNIPDTFVASTLTRYKSVMIKPGWNQISSPFPFSVDWNHCLADTGFENVVWTYVSGALEEYRTIDTLYPYCGYWLYSNYSVNNRIYYPYNSIDQVTSKISTDDIMNAISPSFQLIAEDSKYADHHNYIYIRNDADINWDRYDYREPPAIGNQLSLSILAKDHDNYFCRLAGSYIPYAGNHITFDINVAGQSGQPARMIILANIDTAVFNRAILYDKTSGKNYGFRTSIDTLILPNIPIKAGHAYTITLGTEEYFVNNPVEIEKIPEIFTLGQNYPNPFNSATTIKFGLPEPGHVYLDVLNILGQRVAVLADGQYPSGMHSVSWPGRDYAGKECASGIYLIRARYENTAHIKKTILIK